jgi:hypothetical protein
MRFDTYIAVPGGVHHVFHVDYESISVFLSCKMICRRVAGLTSNVVFH